MKRWIAMVLAAAFAVVTVKAEWDGAFFGVADDDSRDYLNPENWVDGIDDAFIAAPAGGNLNLYFKDNHVTAGDIVIRNPDGSVMRWQGSGGDFTLALTGNLLWDGNDTGIAFWNNAFDIGSGGVAGRRLTLHLPDTGVPHEMRVGYTKTIRLSDGLTGSGDLTVRALGHIDMATLELTASSDTYTGTLTVSPGLVRLPNNVTLLGTPAIRLVSNPASGTPETRLVITGTRAGERTQRIDAATPIFLYGGRIERGLNGINDTVLFIESPVVDGATTTNGIGRLVLASGRSGISHGPATEMTDEQSFFMRTEATSLERINRSVGYFMQPRMQWSDATGGWTADIRVNYPHVGVWRETGNRRSGNALVVTGTPPRTIGGDGSAGTDQPIVPFLFGSDCNHSQNIPSSLVTYHPDTGFRALRRVADYDNSPPEFHGDIFTASENDNVIAETWGTLTEDKTINSLMIGSAAFGLGACTLTLKSGVMLCGDLYGSDNSIVSFGDEEGFIYVFGAGAMIRASFAGANGMTVVAANGDSGIRFQCKNRYTGQTTIIGHAVFGNNSCDTETKLAEGGANVSLPDDGFVLIHPAATLTVGGESANHCTREIVGGVGGCGRVRLAYTGIADENAWKNSALIIGTTGTADDGDVWDTAAGRVILNGGYLTPGMEGRRGTLSFTTATYDGGGTTAFPVELRNGTVNILIDKHRANDAIAVEGALTIGTGKLVLNVTVEKGANIEEGMTWTIATAGTVNAVDGKLFTKIVSSDPYWEFTAFEEGASVKIGATKRLQGTSIIVR